MEGRRHEQDYNRLARGLVPESVYSVDDDCIVIRRGRAEIKQGRLNARKNGKNTVFLGQDLIDYERDHVVAADPATVAAS